MPTSTNILIQSFSYVLFKDKTITDKHLNTLEDNACRIKTKSSRKPKLKGNKFIFH